MKNLGGISVPGLDKEGRPKFNQDRFFVTDKNGSEIILVCDGAGSATFSHIGATAFSRILARNLSRKRDITCNKTLKDTIEHSIEYIFSVLQRFSLRYKASFSKKDFATTILGYINISENICLGMHIGDGAMMFFSGTEENLVYLSEPRNGEYPNQTYFVTDANWRENLRFFEIDFDFDSLLVMTDGVTCMALKGNAPFTQFTSPLLKYLKSNAQDTCEKGIFSTLSSSNSQKASNDDKTLVWSIKC